MNDGLSVAKLAGLLSLAMTIILVCERPMHIVMHADVDITMAPCSTRQAGLRRKLALMHMNLTASSFTCL